jgi:hypothetical protein
MLPYSVTAHTEMIKDLENLKGDLANNIKRFQSSMAKWFPNKLLQP